MHMHMSVPLRFGANAGTRSNLALAQNTVEISTYLRCHIEAEDVRTSKCELQNATSQTRVQAGLRSNSLLSRWPMANKT